MLISTALKIQTYIYIYLTQNIIKKRIKSIHISNNHFYRLKKTQKLIKISIEIYLLFIKEKLHTDFKIYYGE